MSREPNDTGGAPDRADYDSPWKNGQEAWVLMHIEVQGQPEALFPRRMYTYNYRICDRFDRQVASLAILADDSPSWRPDHFSYELWGSKAGLWFPTVKLLDWNSRWEELEASTNPFASVVTHASAVQCSSRPGANQGARKQAK